MNDGGPAFPIAYDNTAEHGMSLLDYFAAAALQGMLSSDSTIDTVVRLAKSGGKPLEEYIASMAYGYADAMLAKREKTE